MKKRKKLMSFLILFCATLVFILSGCKSDQPVDIPPKDIDNSISITKIEVASTENEIGYQNEDYVPGDVIVYAVYTNAEQKVVTEEATFSVDTSTIGTSRVMVSYKEFNTSYVIPIVKNTMESISIDLDSAKILYQTGERLDTSEIKITGKYLNGNEEAISHYRIQLLYEGKNVSELSLPGTYVVQVFVEVSNETLTANYNIKVTGEPVKEKMYTKLELDTTQVKTSFENESFTVEGLLVYGVIDASTKEVLHNDYNIELYYQGNKVNQFENTGEYSVIITYTGSLECVNSKVSYTVSYKNRKLESVFPSIIVLSATEASVEIPLMGSATEFDIVITDEDGKSNNIEQLKHTFTNLDAAKTYSISGSYHAIIEEEEVIINLVPAVFSTGVYSSFEQINQDEVVENISANSIALSIQEFEENAPVGYQLAGFEVLDENGDILYDIKYTQDLEGSLYITDLENETKYLVRPYYETKGSVLSAKENNYHYSIRPSFRSSMEEGYTRETTYTYRIRFVGYWYLTHGDVNYRVRMRYNDTTLYTWYVDSNHHYTNERFCTFILPIELDDYYIVGSSTDLSIVEKDIDAELILALKENSNGKFTVAFYGFNDVLIDVQEIEAGGSASAPSVDSTIQWQGLKYNFQNFDRDFTSISSNIEVHAIYMKEEVKKVPIVYLSFRVASDRVYFCEDYREMSSVVSIERILKDLSGATADKTIEGYQYRTHWYLVNDLTPNTSYKYCLKITYDLCDGNGNQELIKETEFTTVSPEPLENITCTIEKQGYCDVNVTLSGASKSWYYYSPNNGPFYSQSYGNFCLSECPEGTVYFYYGEEDKDNHSITYMYYIGTSYEVPKFETLLIEDNRGILDFHSSEGACLYLKGENLQDRHFIAHFCYYVEENMITEQIEADYIWIGYDPELGHKFASYGMDITQWLMDLSIYEGQLSPIVDIHLSINGFEDYIHCFVSIGFPA